MTLLKYKLYKNINLVDKEIINHIYNNFGAIIDTWDSPKYYIYIVYDKSEWVAYGCLRHHESSNNINTCYSGPTYVKNHYRGQGIQVKLIKKRISLAKRLGYNKMVSSTYFHNYPSNNNLIECGFKTIPPLITQEAESLYWEKTINRTT